MKHTLHCLNKETPCDFEPKEKREYMKMKWEIRPPEEYISKVREKVSVQEMRAFLIVFLAGICLYIPMIVYRLNCSDGNLCGILYRPHNDYDMEDIAGRYLLKYVAHMKSLFVFSWLAVILGLLFLIWGGMLICRILRIDTMPGKVVAGLFIILSPCFIDTFTFYFAADAYLFCFVLASYAVYLLHEKQNLVRMLLAAGCLFLSLTFYQAYLFVAVVLFLYVLLRDLLDDRKNVKEIGKGLLYQLGSGIIAVVVYVVMNKVFKMVGLIFYKESRFNISDILNLPELAKAFVRSYKGFFQYFFNMDFINNGWKARYLVNGLLLALGIILLVSAVCKTKRKWQNIIAIVVCILAMPVAFMGIGILDWREGAPRIIMLPAMALLYVGIWALWFRERKMANNVQRLCGWGIYAGTIYLLVIMSVYVSIYQLCMKYYVDKTDSMAQRIITRIESEYPETVSGSPVFICGDVDEGVYPQDYRITQASYIMRGTQACEGMFVDNMQGYFAGWNAYMKANFGVEYEMAWKRGQEIYDSDFYKEMPLWPEPGCVQKTEDGIVVVKLKY